MIGRLVILSSCVGIGSIACTAQPKAESALCAVANTADTVLAYPDGLACLGSGYGHVIVVNEPCGNMVATKTEDDACVTYRDNDDPRHDWVITKLSTWTAADGARSNVDSA